MGEEIRQNYREIRTRIDQAARRTDRDPRSVTLVAVSKTFPAEDVLALAPLAPVVLGENRVQEAAAKIEATSGTPGLSWHLIGHLQANKANRAAELFDFVHSVDSQDLLVRLGRRCTQLGRRLPILLEVNIGDEESKSGCTETELPALAEFATTLGSIEIRGLMAIPPYLEDSEAVRPYFRRLRELRDRLQDRMGLPLPELSMGMSHDFEVAVEEGATFVRVGTAIFGGRSYLR